jgi:hypothetical protein
MMKTIMLTPQTLTKAILEDLEKRGLVATLRPTPRIKENREMDCAEPLYISAAAAGPHQLLAVRKNVTQIRLTFHNDNEEVIFLRPPAANFKPLFLVIAGLPLKEFQAKVARGTLDERDVLALTVTMNDPETAVFTILKDTVHCEVTTAGPGEAPVFYVSEPSAMTMRYVDLKETSLRIKTEGTE